MITHFYCHWNGFVFFPFFLRRKKLETVNRIYHWIFCNRSSFSESKSFFFLSFIFSDSSVLTNQRAASFYFVEVFNFTASSFWIFLTRQNEMIQNRLSHRNMFLFWIRLKVLKKALKRFLGRGRTCSHPTAFSCLLFLIFFFYKMIISSWKYGSIWLQISVFDIRKSHSLLVFDMILFLALESVFDRKNLEIIKTGQNGSSNIESRKKI